MFCLGRSIGKPIAVDPRNLRHDYGYSSAKLVDIDFARPINYDIVIDAEDQPEGLYQSFEILNMPKFCDYCKFIGHDESECRNKKYNDLKKKAGGEADPINQQAIFDEMAELKNFWHKKEVGKNQFVQPQQTEQVTRPMEVDPMVNQGEGERYYFHGNTCLHSKPC